MNKRTENSKQEEGLDAMNADEYLEKVKKIDSKVRDALAATVDAINAGRKVPDSRDYEIVAARADARLFSVKLLCAAKIRDLEEKGEKEEIKKWEEILKIAENVPTSY